MSIPTEPIGGIARPPVLIDEHELPEVKQALEQLGAELEQQREWRRTAERALRASDERLRAILTHAAVGIAVADLSGHFHEANQKFCDALGYSADELRARTFLEITHAEDREATRTEARRLVEGAIRSYTIRKRYVRSDGTDVWGNTTVTLLKGESADAVQFLGIVEDITDRKQAEELRGRLAAVVECSDDAIVTKTLDGTITTWNPGAERIFGYTAQEIVGKPITVLIPPDRVDEELSILARLKRGERIDHYETIRRTRDGTLLNVSLSVSPLRDASGRIIGASKIARDITRQKRAEEALRDLYAAGQREIASRQRAEAALRDTDRRKDEFLATLAHELRNPLAPIRQAALISKSAAATDAQKRWSHDVISRQVQHMSLLLDDLLDISRITRGTLELRTEMTELAAVVDAAVETARPAIDAKRHEFTLELPSEPVLFAGDPLRLAQVLSNLLTNAAKYTDPQGRIRLHATSDAGQVTITISDTGVGIPHDALTRVFAMFSQVKSSQDRAEGGLGIGLALAKGLVELHGGSIEARSPGIGRGSDFVVRLPRRSLHPSRMAQSAAVPTEKPVSRRVLIADDNRDAAESLAMLLRLEGHDVTVVHDGREALATIKDLLPEVALLDIGMPELDGYEVARQVRQESLGRAVTLIAVTGWGQQSDKALALAAGFNHHFTKPVEPERLSQLLRDIPG
jgi:PAS domain S-box-containing protein